MFLSVREIGRGGVNTELPPYDLPPNMLTKADNARFWDGTCQRHPDPQRVTVNGVPWNTDESGNNNVEFQTWIDRDGTPQYAYGTLTKLYIWDNVGTDWEDASKLDASGNEISYTSSDEWDSIVFGDTCLFVNENQVPQMLEDGDANFSDLTAWDATKRCKRLRKYKSFLIALGVSEGATFLPNKVLWSAEAETNSVPASWDVTDDSVLAGDTIISADDGEIVDGRELGDVFIIYTTRAIYEMSYIGPPFVFSFRRVAENSILGPKCVSTFDNFHFVVGADEIYVHDGQTINHIADQRVRQILFDSLVTASTVRVETNPITKEVFVIYDDGSTVDVSGNAIVAASRCMVWCYRYDAFSFISLPGIRTLRYGYLPGTVTTWADLSGNGIQWDELVQTWAQFASSDQVPAMFLLGKKSANIQQMDALYSDTSQVESVVERTGLDLDQLLTKPTNTVKLIKQMLPQIEGDSGQSVTFQLGYSDTPQGVVTWLTSQNYQFADDYRVDLFTVGRYLAWRMLTKKKFRLTGMDIDVEEVGER